MFDVVFSHYFLVHSLEGVEEREMVVFVLDDDSAELQFRVAMSKWVLFLRTDGRKHVNQLCVVTTHTFRSDF